MARGKSRSVTSRREESVDSEEDTQTLKRNGKASFNRDETFDNSEDECKNFEDCSSW